MSKTKSNLDYNVQDKEPLFNTRKTFCETARQITNDDCSNDAIAELVRITREHLNNEN